MRKKAVAQWVQFEICPQYTYAGQRLRDSQSHSQSHTETVPDPSRPAYLNSPNASAFTNIYGREVGITLETRRRVARTPRAALVNQHLDDSPAHHDQTDILPASAQLEVSARMGSARESLPGPAAAALTSIHLQHFNLAGIITSWYLLNLAGTFYYLAGTLFYLPGKIVFCLTWQAYAGTHV